MTRPRTQADTATTAAADLASVDLASVPAIDHREGMTLARIAYDRFATEVERLGPDDWNRPTDCDGWTVRHLVGHLVGAMRSSASTREMVSQLREINARTRRDGGSMTDTMTQVQIDRVAGLDLDELRAECRRLVDPATAGRQRTPAPLRRLVGFRVQLGSIDERWTLGYLLDVILTRDAWLHRVDLCRAVDRPIGLDHHDARIVADVAAEWARRHGQPCRLTLTGPAGGRFHAGDGGEQLDLDAVEFCRMLSGRASGTGLLATEVPF